MAANRRRFSKCGGGSVSDGLTGRLSTELLALQQARESFPLWTSRGLPDGTIHSAGISMLTALGQALGYEAYCEIPAPRKGRYAHVGDDVRSDSGWFDRNTGCPVLLAEFERYSGQIDEGRIADQGQESAVGPSSVGRNGRVPCPCLLDKEPAGSTGSRCLGPCFPPRLSDESDGAGRWIVQWRFVGLSVHPQGS